MGALEVLASHTPFRKLQTNTEISTEEHRKFFVLCGLHTPQHDVG
jgi:hypothetical protein